MDDSKIKLDTMISNRHARFDVVEEWCLGAKHAERDIGQSCTAVGDSKKSRGSALEMTEYRHE